MSSTNQKINITFNKNVLDNYGELIYPKFSIAVNYGDDGLGGWEDAGCIEEFLPYEKDKLINYINNDLQEELKNYDNIHSVEILWEEDENFCETIDTIYIRPEHYKLINLCEKLDKLNKQKNTISKILNNKFDTDIIQNIIDCY